MSPHQGPPRGLRPGRRSRSCSNWPVAWRSLQCRRHWSQVLLAAAGATAILLLLAVKAHALLRMHAPGADRPLAEAAWLPRCRGQLAPTRPHRHPLLSNEWPSNAHNISSSSSSSSFPTQDYAMQQGRLGQPQQQDVAASMLRLQAHLASSEFAAAQARLLQGRHGPVGRQQQPGPTTLSSSSSSHAGHVGSLQAPQASRQLLRRGILVVAGGRKLLTHLIVQLKVLRELLGCTLPVEVAWQGAREMDNRTFEALQRHFGPLTGFDVQAVPHPPAIRRVTLTRWVGKTAALLYCSFQEVLLLDSDNLPLLDPTPLFEDPLYAQHGNLFWPDFWGDWVQPGVFPFLGINRTAVQPLLAAGAGHTGRDAESGMLLIDRRRWLGVLHRVLWINSWHDRLYYRMIHGDKDTFALAFALAGHADKYRQVSVPPAGVFRWGKDQLEIKCTGPAGSCNTTDGWQLLGPLQHDDTGRALFFHRTMNKLSLDEQPWPADVVTGPLPTSWLQYYLAHNTLGPTKGVWWEHVVPNSAFTPLLLSRQQPGSHATGRAAAAAVANTNGAGSRSYTSTTSSSSGSSIMLRSHTSGTSCNARVNELYSRALAAGLPVGPQPLLECRCPRHLVQPTHEVLNSSASVAPGQPVVAARVDRQVLALSPALQAVQASLRALRWLDSAEGRAAFPSLAPGGGMV